MFRKLNYLTHRANLFLFFILFLGFYFGGFSIWILSAPALFFLFISRRQTRTIQDTARLDSEIFIAPITGKIEKIEIYQNEQLYIKIRMSLFGGWGLYLPLNSEMKHLRIKEGDHVLQNSLDVQVAKIESYHRTEIELFSARSRNYLMYCLHPSVDRLPKIWMKSGDKGVGAACFGFFPFGGWVFVVLPKNSDLLVVENEHIVAGESVIAVIKDN